MGYDRIRRASPRERLKFLLGDSVLYGGGTAVAKAFSVLLLPILTRLLSTTEYGAVDVLAVTGAVIVFMATIGQDSAVARFYYETEDPEERRQVVSQALAVQAVLSIALGLALFGAAGPMASRFLGDPGLAGAIRVVAVGIPFTVLLQFSRNLLKWTFARAKFLFVSVGWAACLFLLTVWWVAWRDAGLYGVVYAQLTATIFVSLCGLYFCRAHLSVPHEWRFLGGLLRFGWPYMLVGLLGALIPAVDRTFITSVMGLEAVGLYAVGYKLAFLLLIPTAAFQTAWNPMALAIYKEPDAAETYDRVLLYFAAAITVIAGSVAILADHIVEIFATARYLAGSVVVLPLAFALVVETTSWILGIGVDLSKRTYLSAVSYLLGLVVAVAAIALLIGPFGLAGVAYGVLAGKLTQAVTYSLAGFMSYPLRFSLGVPTAVIVLGFAVCATRGLVGGRSLALDAVFLLLLGAVAASAVLLRGRSGPRGPAPELPAHALSGVEGR
jgi:O-antigen/teichoic acid export membrane protein